MRTLLIEPFGGLAGDMLLAALLDLEDPRFRLEDLRTLADALVPGEARLCLSEVRRGAFRGRLLAVETPESAHAPHRHLSDLVALLARAPLGPETRARAERVLARIADAEAEVHGCAREEVHFHEVGAVDTLLDVAGAVSALERLGVGRVLARPPYVGGGTVAGAHGTMPVPAPGTAALLRGVPHVLGVGGERLTPTGAALLSELVDRFVGGPGDDPGGETFRPERSGTGAGAREPAEGPPNLARVQLGAEAEGGAQAGVAIPRGTAWLLEVNLDDTTPEEVGFLLAALREAGALEAWTAPVWMKKDRPGVLVSALARAERRGALEAACFAHTATLGLRWSPRERAECPRETLTVDLAAELGGSRDPAPVRVVRRLVAPGAGPGPLDLSPEYDDLAALARATGRPLRELEGLAIALARRLLADA